MKKPHWWTKSSLMLHLTFTGVDMMMRKNNDNVYTDANNTKDNFLLYTEMNVDQVVLIKLYY